MKRGSDQDPMNHCRTTEAAFEREFRKGLDVLITVPELKIGIAAPVRVTLNCATTAQNKLFSSWRNLRRSCGNGLLVTYALLVSAGLSRVDCSDERLQDGYETARAYRDIMERVSARSMPPWLRERSSPEMTVGGETVGGAVKAAGTSLASVMLLGCTSLRANSFRAVTVSTRRFRVRMGPPASCLTALPAARQMCAARTPETPCPTPCV